MSIRSIAGLVGLGVVAAMTSFAQVSPAVSKELRFVHAYPVASQHHRNVEWFTEQVTARTNGEVTFRVFPSAQLTVKWRAFAM